MTFKAHIFSVFYGVFIKTSLTILTPLSPIRNMLWSYLLEFISVTNFKQMPLDSAMAYN